MHHFVVADGEQVLPVGRERRSSQAPERPPGSITNSGSWRSRRLFWPYTAPATVRTTTAAKARAEIAHGRLLHSRVGAGTKAPLMRICETVRRADNGGRNGHPDARGDGGPTASANPSSTARSRTRSTARRILRSYTFSS